MKDIVLEIGNEPKVGSYYPIAPSLYALVIPFGVDILGGSDDVVKLQVWLLIRPTS